MKEPKTFRGINEFAIFMTIFPTFKKFVIGLQVD